MKKRGWRYLYSYCRSVTQVRDVAYGPMAISLPPPLHPPSPALKQT